MCKKLLADSGAQAAIEPTVGDRCRRSASCEVNSTALSVAAQPSKKQRRKRRKSRAIPKPPVRELCARDTLHFKTMVQQFTGLPTPTSSLSSQPPSRPAPPATPPAVAPNASSTLGSSTSEYPLLTSSAIAHSLQSTVHLISACLQLLQRFSSSRSNCMGPSQEPSMYCEQKSPAFLQGLSLGTHQASGGCLEACLARLSNHLGPFANVGHNSLLGDLRVTLNDGARDPKTAFAMLTQGIPNTDHHADNSYCSGDCGVGVPPTPFVGTKTRIEKPSSTNDSLSICHSSDCEGSRSKHLISFEALEAPESTNNRFGIPRGDVGGSDDSLSSLHASPPEENFHGEFDIYQESIGDEELILVENTNIEPKQEGQLRDKVKVQAKELEKFLFEEHNKIDFVVSSFPVPIMS